MGRQGVAYIDGQFCPVAEAKLSIMDGAFFHGASVFDVLGAYRGHILMFAEHVERFLRAAHTVRIVLPHSRTELEQIILETVRRSGLQDAYIGCVATRGLWSSAPIDRWTPDLIVFSIPYVSIFPPDVVERGGSLRITSIRNLPVQCLDPKIKSYNRLHSYLAKLEAMDAGDDEPLMLDLNGYVAESRGANIFAVRRGALHTPGENVLEGITRMAALELARREGLLVHEARMTPQRFLYTSSDK